MASGQFHSKVVGVTARNDDGKSRQDYIRAFCTPGMPIAMRPEPGNKYDKNAVAVWVKARAFLFFTSDVQIGYLSADIAEEIAKYLLEGGTVRGEITDVTGGSTGKASMGVNIMITKT